MSLAALSCWELDTFEMFDSGKQIIARRKRIRQPSRCFRRRSTRMDLPIRDLRGEGEGGNRDEHGILMRVRHFHFSFHPAMICGGTRVNSPQPGFVPLPVSGIFEVESRPGCCLLWVACILSSHREASFLSARLEMLLRPNSYFPIES